MKALFTVAAVLMMACSGRGDSEADARDTLPDTGPADNRDGEIRARAEYHPLFDFVGTILMVEDYFYTGELKSGKVTVTLMDAVMIHHELVQESGSCKYYALFEVPDCDPPCGGNYCGWDEECHPYPARASAGPIHFDGLKVDVAALPQEEIWYKTEGEIPGQDGLFDIGTKIVVTADGDQIAAFQAHVEGLGIMNVDFENTLNLLDGEDNEITWTPQGDGATIELAVRTGFHGQPETDIIWCTAPDEEGAIVIPQELVEAYPPSDGNPLTQHFSRIRRVRRQIVETMHGPIEVLTSSNIRFYATHGF